MNHDTTRSSRRRKPDSLKISIRGRWTAIPNKLLTDTRLSRDARMLGCLIFMHAGNSERAFPSQEELATELGHNNTPASVRSVQRWLTELRQTGWLVWRQTLRNNEYTLLDPTEDEHDDTIANDANENSDSSASNASNEFLTRATLLSPTTTQESCSNTTEESSRATLVSRSNTTDGSPHTTPVSRSTLLDSDSNKDSYKTESSSSDSTTTHHPDNDDDVPTQTELFLQEQNLGVAKELRHMPLETVQHYIREAKERGASLPAIAKGLRALWRREQARKQELTTSSQPPAWLNAAVWPELPDDLRSALEHTEIDGEGYLCYDERYDAVIVAHQALVKALIQQARSEQVAEVSA